MAEIREVARLIDEARARTIEECITAVSNRDGLLMDDIIAALRRMK